MKIPRHAKKQRERKEVHPERKMRPHKRNIKVNRIFILKRTQRARLIISPSIQASEDQFTLSPSDPGVGRGWSPKQKSGISGLCPVRADPTATPRLRNSASSSWSRNIIQARTRRLRATATFALRQSRRGKRR